MRISVILLVLCLLVIQCHCYLLTYLLCTSRNCGCSSVVYSSRRL